MSSGLIRRLELAREADAERALREEIRRSMAERAMWTKQLDQYGRTYYSHCETGEAAWEVSRLAERLVSFVYVDKLWEMAAETLHRLPARCITNRRLDEMN